ncbi:peptide chain release factor N(5)-glutamine methyltransferase [Candidatus Saganbacteria bacterium]|nr:peptide chain release factor N(5)-glutamine methyltransferase [Candidatus Saganbacteria bacterium]
METWTITNLLDWTTNYLKRFHIPDNRLEAGLLLAYCLKLRRLDLYLNFERLLSVEEWGRFKTLLERRTQHEPLAYITNNQPFMSLDFYVDRHVLIPRPETELLIEEAVALISHLPAHMGRLAGRHGSSLVISHFAVADIGTGSGCIAVCLAKYAKNVAVIAIDSSPEALKIAEKNARAHQVNDKCQFILGNLLAPLTSPVAMIIANLPYIPTAAIAALQPEVKDWEPREALDGGPDGLTYIRPVIEQAPSHLNSNGYLLLEIGYDQGEKVRSIAEATGQYQNIMIIKDLVRCDRILAAQKI